MTSYLTVCVRASLSVLLFGVKALRQIAKDSDNLTDARRIALD